MIAPTWMASGLLAACTLPDPEHALIRSAIEASAERFDMPARWIASVMTEESGDRACRDGPPIRSRVGAAGAMQVMRPTWLETQAVVNPGSSIDDPVANIAVGSAYLRKMYDRFGYPGMFAAYNAGPRRYGQSLTGRPLPRETLHYLDAILRRLKGQPMAPDPTSGGDQIALFAMRSATPSNAPRDQATLQSRMDGDLFFLRR